MTAPILVSQAAIDRLSRMAADLRAETGRSFTFAEVVDHVLGLDGASAD